MVEVMAIKAAFFGLEVNWQKTKCICVHVSHATTSQIVESCPLTKLNGGLSQLHSVDEDAVSWLTSYGSWQAYEKKKQSSLYQLFSLSSVYSRDLTVLSNRQIPTVSEHMLTLCYRYDMIQRGLTSHLTHHGSFQRWSSQPIIWLVQKLVFLTSHLAGTNKTNVTTTKWQHKNLDNK